MVKPFCDCQNSKLIFRGANQTEVSPDVSGNAWVFNTYKKYELFLRCLRNNHRY